MSRATGIVTGIVAAILFGANGSLTKVVIEAGLTPLQVTLFRSLGTCVLAGLALLLMDRGAFRITWRRLGAMALLGIVGIALMQATYAGAISLLPVGIALLLEYLAVLVVAVFARLVYRERVRPQVWVAIALVLGGLAIVARIWDSHLDALGVVLALAAAVFLAFYLLYGERQTAATSPMAVLFWGCGFSSIFWFAFSGWWDIDPAAFTTAVSMRGALDGLVVPLWVPLVAVLVLGSFLPFLLSFLALVRLKATTAGILASSEIVFAFAVAWLWLGETLDVPQLLGAAVVVLGIVLAQTARPGSVVEADLALPPTGPIPRVSPERPST